MLLAESMTPADSRGLALLVFGSLLLLGASLCVKSLRQPAAAHSDRVLDEMILRRRREFASSGSAGRKAV